MVNNENIELVETEEYKEFVDKFKIKLTTATLLPVCMK